MAEFNTPDRTETIWFANPKALTTDTLQCLALGLGKDETTHIHSKSLMELCNVLNIVLDTQLAQMNTGCDGQNWEALGGTDEPTLGAGKAPAVLQRVGTQTFPVCATVWTKAKQREKDSRWVVT